MTTRPREHTTASPTPPRPSGPITDGPLRGRLLITAGPTHEPIDRVRYIGNRSSGRLGVELADEAARQGWTVTLLLGPTHLAPTDSRVSLHRFRTTGDLESLLREHFDAADVLVMAAAVADYRPKPIPEAASGKLRRSAGALSLDLEPTPDLLAGCAARRRDGQTIVGFALEPRDRLLESARDKLRRKGLDLIVANELETMDSATVRATVLAADGSTAETPGEISKAAFAPWLLNILQSARRTRSRAQH